MKRYTSRPQLNPESTEWEIRNAYQTYHSAFSPKLQEFKSATMQLVTPKNLKSKASKKKMIEQHRKNALEYINGCSKEFKIYLETLTALTLVQYLEDEGKTKIAIELRPAIEKSIRDEWREAMKEKIADIADIEEIAPTKPKTLKVSKKYIRGMNKKFGIKEKKN